MAGEGRGREHREWPAPDCGRGGGRQRAAYEAQEATKKAKGSGKAGRKGDALDVDALRAAMIQVLGSEPPSGMQE